MPKVLAVAGASSSQSAGKKHQCAECDYSTDRTFDMRRHAELHLPEDQRHYYECPKPGCAKRFLQKGNLKIHLAAHAGVPTHFCAQCDFACTDPSALHKHRKRHGSGSGSRTVVARGRKSRVRRHPSPATSEESGLWSSVAPSPAASTSTCAATVDAFSPPALTLPETGGCAASPAADVDVLSWLDDQSLVATPGSSPAYSGDFSPMVAVPEESYVSRDASGFTPHSGYQSQPQQAYDAQSQLSYEFQSQLSYQAQAQAQLCYDYDHTQPVYTQPVYSQPAYSSQPAYPSEPAYPTQPAAPSPDFLDFDWSMPAPAADFDGAAIFGGDLELGMGTHIPPAMDLGLGFDWPASASAAFGYSS